MFSFFVQSDFCTTVKGSILSLVFKPVISVKENTIKYCIQRKCAHKVLRRACVCVFIKQCEQPTTSVHKHTHTKGHFTFRRRKTTALYCISS